MPRNRPAVSGYARIAQADEEDEERPYSDNEDPFQDPLSLTLPHEREYVPIDGQPKRRERMPPSSLPSHPSGAIFGSRRSRRRRTNSGVDIKAINARLERWAEEIKERFKIRRVKGRSAEDEHLEIYNSVFQAPEGIRPATKETLDNEYDDAISNSRLSKLEFDDMVESVRTAIELGMHPKLITQGSSGSYFARNSGGKTLGVFKPKDEEPYASKNPKWTKWLHRNLLPFAFGRACLIPNLSYVSEAAAYVLDVQLRTGLVPYTDVVNLSSKSFHYDWIDRRRYYRKRRPFPEKPGSFQVFLKGYKGATEFFQEHPWPDQQTSAFRDAVPAPKPKRRKRWDETCRPGSGQADEDAGSEDESEGLTRGDRSRVRQEFWSAELQRSFRDELEKLVVLDYIMRNTDRGTDNWMIKIDREKQEARLVVEPAQQNGHMDKDTDGYQRREDNMTTAPNKNTHDKSIPHLGAIDNSLSWPWKHPDGWRSYPFGWLYLPVSLIGRPFSENTRKHFIPLLTSKHWWRETQVKLRQCFELDADFQGKMYARQIAVMKGQAWNVLETLKTPDHGPLELARRGRVLVWDDVVEVPVAVPLTRPSEEMRRMGLAAQQVDGGMSGRAVEEEEEEMDISAAYDAADDAEGGDLLGMSSPIRDREAARNPFNHSRQNSSQDVVRRPELSSPSLAAKEFASPASLQPSSAAIRPSAVRSRTRMSSDVPRVSWQSPALPERRRRFSFAALRGKLDGEDDDGDLGYAAASERESLMRKVIVERLEMVRTKGPFFSWC